jgi:hypothetical protein
MPALVALETHIAGLADLIIDYATARRCEEPFSTSPTDGAVQWLLHRRMAAQQQMRWSPRGAHLMLKVRTSISTAHSIAIMPPQSDGRAVRFGKQHDHPQVMDGLLCNNRRSVPRPSRLIGSAFMTGTARHSLRALASVPFDFAARHPEKVISPGSNGRR